MAPNNEPFNWELCYKNRIERLQKLIRLNAPVTIIDAELKLVRQAIHKGNKQVLWYDFKRWLWHKWAKVRYYHQAKQWVKEAEEENDGQK